MRTLVIIAVGMALFGAAALVGKWTGGPRGIARAAMLFWVVWLVAAAANLYVGVTRAGYTVVEELPIFLVVFGVPAAVAFVVWKKARRV